MQLLYLYIKSVTKLFLFEYLDFFQAPPALAWLYSLTIQNLSCRLAVRHYEKMSDFTMGTILGKGFAQAQVQTVNSTSAEGTSAIDSRHECLSKTFSQDCPHGEIAFSSSSHFQKIRFCFLKKLQHLFHLLWCKGFFYSRQIMRPFHHGEMVLFKGFFLRHSCY